jgi:hypothetical protein
MSTNSSSKISTDRRPRKGQQERPHRIASRLLTLTIFSGMLLASNVQAFCGELLIEGEANAVHVEARDVPLRQLLDAMQAKFNLRYRSDGALDSPVTGVFDGQVRRVAARLLEDYDFVMKMKLEGLDILIMQRHSREIKSAGLAPKIATNSAAFSLTSDQILGVILSGRLPKRER